MNPSVKAFVQMIFLSIFGGVLYAQQGTQSAILTSSDKQLTELEIAMSQMGGTKPVDLSIESRNEQLQKAIEENKKASENIKAIQEAQKQRELEYEAALTNAVFSGSPDFFGPTGGSEYLETAELVVDLFTAPEFGSVIGVDPAIENPSSNEYKERQKQIAEELGKQKAIEDAAQKEKERLEKERMEREYHERMERHHSEVERFKREKDNYRCPF